MTNNSVSEAKKKESKNYFKVFLPSCCLSYAISFMLMLYEPFMLYFNNTDEFWFNFKMIFVPHLAGFVFVGTAIFLCYLIAYLLFDQFHDVLVFLGLIIFISLYIQGNFMIRTLPQMDGSAINWTEYTGEIRASHILWISILIGIVLLIRILTPKLMKKIIPFVCAGMSLLMLITCTAACIGNHGLRKKTNYTAVLDNELTLGSEENLVILMLDAMDSKTFREMMETDHPEWKETFNDFTYYPNTLGVYPYTEYAVPFILTEQWYENNGDFRSFVTESMDNSPLFASLEKRGYDMGLYENVLIDDSKGHQRFSNVIEDYPFVFRSRLSYLKRMTKHVLFKYLPYSLKKYIHIDAGGFDDLKSTNEHGPTPVPFWDSNRQFYGDLQSQGISLSEKPKTFRFIHLDGAHTPFVYDKDVNRIDEKGGSYPQMEECCVTIIDAYLKALRESGLYENTAVIIMADHGYGYRNGEVLDYRNLDYYLNRGNPFLMVKGINEKHDLSVSEAPISYIDLMDGFERILNGSPSSEMFDWKEGDQRVRRYIAYYYLQEHHMEEYTLDGYATDTDKMVPTGKVFELDK